MNWVTGSQRIDIFASGTSDEIYVLSLEQGIITSGLGVSPGPDGLRGRTFPYRGLCMTDRQREAYVGIYVANRDEGELRHFVGTVHYSGWDKREIYIIPPELVLRAYVSCSSEPGLFALQLSDGLYKLDARGDNPQIDRMYETQTDQLRPSFSPDNQQIAISERINNNREILIVDAHNGRVLRQLTNTPNQDETNPDFTQ